MQSKIIEFQRVFLEQNSFHADFHLLFNFFFQLLIQKLDFKSIQKFLN